MDSIVSRRRFGSLFGRLGGVALAALALGACAAPAEESEPNAQPEATGKTSQALAPNLSFFSIDSYEDSLRAALQNANGMGGYSYAIYKNGSLLRSGAAGLARKSPQVSWTADTPFSMMSMGKTITAAAFVKLIAERDDISLGSSVKEYLPKEWHEDAHFNPVTFRHMLSHTSGLTTGTDPWSGIEAQVETNVLPAGSTVMVDGQSRPAGVGTYYYSNTNFTLGRVVMAYMLDKTLAEINEGFGLGPSHSAYTYRARVMQSIFFPIGLDTTKVDVKPIGASPAGFYSADGTKSYFEPTDGSTVLDAGAGYWNLSAKSYAKFLDALVNGKYDVVKNGSTIEIWKHMTTMVAATNTSNVGLGLFRVTGDRGDYYTHNGGWSNGQAGACSRWMVYPNGLSAVWVMNSGVKNANGDVVCPVANQQQMMVDAYDNAWSGVIAVPLP